MRSFIYDVTYTQRVPLASQNVEEATSLSIITEQDIIIQHTHTYTHIKCYAIIYFTDITRSQVISQASSHSRHTLNIPVLILALYNKTYPALLEGNSFSIIYEEYIL